VAAIGMAGLAAERGMEVFNLFHVRGTLAILLSVLALDLAIYLRQLMFHAVPLLWRLHKVHHAKMAQLFLSRYFTPAFRMATANGRW
jgi:sterol desaturase/sphingolipid hydroxylase (fatty acid hydroxylase superfamily)